MKARYDATSEKGGWFIREHMPYESRSNNVIVQSNTVRMLDELNIDRHLKLDGTVSVWRPEGTVTQLAYIGAMFMNRENGLIHGFGNGEEIDKETLDQDTTIAITLEVICDYDDAGDGLIWLSNPSYSVVPEITLPDGTKTELEDVLTDQAFEALVDTLIACHEQGY